MHNGTLVIRAELPGIDLEGRRDRRHGGPSGHPRRAAHRGDREEAEGRGGPSSVTARSIARSRSPRGRSSTTSRPPTRTGSSRSSPMPAEVKEAVSGWPSPWLNRGDGVARARRPSGAARARSRRATFGCCNVSARGAATRRPSRLGRRGGARTCRRGGGPRRRLTSPRPPVGVPSAGGPTPSSSTVKVTAPSSATIRTCTVLAPA